MIFNISIVEVHHNMLKMNKLGEDVPAGPGHWRLHALGSTRARDHARRVRQPGDHHADSITRGRAVPPRTSPLLPSPPRIAAPLSPSCCALLRVCGQHAPCYIRPRCSQNSAPLLVASYIARCRRRLHVARRRRLWLARPGTSCALPLQPRVREAMALTPRTALSGARSPSRPACPVFPIWGRAGKDLGHGLMMISEAAPFLF